MSRNPEFFDQVFGPRAHLSAERVAGYVGGSLSPERAQRVESHLSHCEACRREVADVKAAVIRAQTADSGIDALISGILPDVRAPTPRADLDPALPPLLRIIDGGGNLVVHAWPSGLPAARWFSGRRRAAASDGALGVGLPPTSPAAAPREAYVFEVSFGTFRVLEGSGRFYVEFLDGSAPAELVLDGARHRLVPAPDHPGLLAAPSLRGKTLDVLEYALRRNRGGVDVRWQ